MLDKSAITKNHSSSHQSSTSHQSEDNTYSQDILNVLGPYPFDCPQEPKDITDARILHATWKSLAPPIKEDNLKEYYYAVIYIDPKNNKRMFVGKVLQRWFHDEQGSVQSIIFDFFKKEHYKYRWWHIWKVWQRWYRYRYYTNPSNCCWSIKCHFDFEYLLPIKGKNKNFW